MTPILIYASTTHVLDDPLWRQADGVPLRDAGRTDSDVQADPGEASGRRHDVVRAWEALAVGGGGARGVRPPPFRSSRPAAVLLRPEVHGTGLRRDPAEAWRQRRGGRKTPTETGKGRRP